MEKYENLGLLYNRHYHYHPNFRDNKTKANKKLWKYAIDSSDKPAIGNNVEHLFFETTYPGLIVGIGYPHETEKDQNEAIITGFFFDHTSGAPCIPGSSIKGVVRSVIKNQKFMVEYLAPGNMKEIISGYNNEEFEGFIECLFGRDPSKHNAHETDEISIYNRLIFLDSYAVDNSETTAENRVFSLDYLAPHKDNGVSSLLSDPDLVKVLKVVPKVVFDFSFIIPENIEYLNTIFSREDIIRLLKNAILEVGVGAKTNTGYGYLVPVDEYTRKSRVRKNGILDSTMTLMKAKKKDAQSYQENIKDFGVYTKGKVLEGTILEISDGNIYISYMDDVLIKTEKSVRSKFDKAFGNSNSYELKPELPVRIRVNNDFSEVDKNFTVLPVKN